MPAVTQNQEQFATDASLMKKSHQLVGNEEPGCPLGFDGNNFYFYPTGPHQKWEFPVDQLPFMAYNLTRAKLTDMGSNAVLLDAVLALKSNLPIESSDLDGLICGLHKDHSLKRTMLQTEIERNQFEATALIEPEASSTLSKLFNDPTNVGKMINSVLTELEFVLGTPDMSLVEAGFAVETQYYEQAELEIRHKLCALGTILEYYFYLVQVGYYAVSRAVRFGHNIHGLSTESSTAAANNPFAVRTCLPVHGYSVVYRELLSVEDSLNRLVSNHVVNRSMFDFLESKISMFQIASYMELYFMGQTIDWRRTALLLAQSGVESGRYLAIIFRMLGLEEFEQRVLGGKRIYKWVWEGYHVHIILAERIKSGWMAPRCRWEGEEEGEYEGSVWGE